MNFHKTNACIPRSEDLKKASEMHATDEVTDELARRFYQDDHDHDVLNEVVLKLAMAPELPSSTRQSPIRLARPALPGWIICNMPSIDASFRNCDNHSATCPTSERFLRKSPGQHSQFTVHRRFALLRASSHLAVFLLRYGQHFVTSWSAPESLTAFGFSGCSRCFLGEGLPVYDGY